MRFTVYSIASVALLLGSTPEPVQATSLLVQQDSQGAFDELLQLDSQLDAYADLDVDADADADAEGLTGGKAKKLAQAVLELRNYMEQTKLLYSKDKYERDYKGRVNDYCVSEAKLNQKSFDIERDLNAKMHKLKVVLNSYAKDDDTVPQLYHLMKEEELKKKLNIAPTADAKEREELVMEGISKAKGMFDAQVLKDYSSDNNDQVAKYVFNKDNHIKGGQRTLKVEQMTEALNYLAGSYDDTRNYSGLLGKDNRRYLGAHTYVQHLLKRSCGNEGSEKATTFQTFKDDAKSLILALSTLAGDLTRILVNNKTSSDPALINVNMPK